LSIRKILALSALRGLRFFVEFDGAVAIALAGVEFAFAQGDEGADFEGLLSFRMLGVIGPATDSTLREP
jgi:hypothetical protein